MVALCNTNVLVPAPPSIGGFGAVISDAVIAYATAQAIRTAIAVDRVGTTAAGDDMAPAEPAIETAVERAEALTFWKFVTVTILPVVWSALTRLTAAAACITKVLVPAPPSTVEFRTAIGDRIVARAGNDVIRAAIAIDNVVAGSRRDVVPAGRAGNGHTGGHGARVEIFEIRHRDRVAGGLVDPRRDAEVHRRDSAAGGENERIGSCARVDRILRYRGR